MRLIKKLRLIFGRKKTKEAMLAKKKKLEKKAFLDMTYDSLGKAFSDNGVVTDRAELKKAAYRFVRLANLIGFGGIEDEFRGYESLLAVISLMTPREFIETFPVTKEFNGHKYGIKDYFSVMEEIRNNYPMDTPIMSNGEDCSSTMLKFLMEYCNTYTDKLTISIMLNIGNMHKMHTGRDMLDDFMISQGKEPLSKQYLCEGADGKQFMVDEDGKSSPVKKSKPRYLKGV